MQKKQFFVQRPFHHTLENHSPGIQKSQLPNELLLFSPKTTVCEILLVLPGVIPEQSPDIDVLDQFFWRPCSEQILNQRIFFPVHGARR